MDFSNYRIYIPDDSYSACHLFLLDEEESLRACEESFSYSFDEGIRKMQKESRWLRLTGSLNTKEVSDYFEKQYGIYAA